MLPKAMRDAIWAEYVPGQEVRRDPTPEYLAVAGRAERWLYAKEHPEQVVARLPQ